MNLVKLELMELCGTTKKREYSHEEKDEELRKQVSALAVTGAEKLLKREIDANAHKALLDELASEI